MKFSVMSLNMHQGYSIFRLAPNINILVKLLKKCEFDFLCLQEVPLDHPDINKLKKEVLSDGHWIEQSLVEFPETGRQGNVILSRYHFDKVYKVDLSFSSREPRGVLLIKSFLNSKPVYIANVHLGLNGKERSYQLIKLDNFFRDAFIKDTPILLMGDFNDWRNRLKVSKLLSQTLKNVSLSIDQCYFKTFPSWLPIFTLDHIYFRNVKPQYISSFRKGFWRIISDHLPLYAEFTL